MKTFLFFIFVALMAFLIVQFIRDLMNKEKQETKAEDPALHSLLIPAIIASLITQGLISKETAEELEDFSVLELEEYVVNEGIFESTEDWEDWILHQEEMAAVHNDDDSVFPGL